MTIKQLNKPIFFPLLLISILLIVTFFIFVQQREDIQVNPATDEQQAFINEIASEAKRLQKQTNLFASITIAQAILESDWGKSDLATQANNLFGIKGSYNNQSSVLPTEEYIEGKQITIDDAFKKYETIQESMIDHMTFLEGSTYQSIQTSKNYREAALALQEGGYATDPEYANKLIALIEEFQLDTYDT